MNKERIEKILTQLNTGIYEKEEVIAVSLLDALAGLNTFLLGPPGTAKSLIARRIASAFESDNYFELLLNKFSTPEEVFGPIKLSELKEDNYERQTKGYLPTADVAFLDEIWKANSAILNTLLTIINEKTFKNGTDDPIKVPLKALISASNETPQAGQGLEALYDRFVIRLNVPPIENEDHFIDILESPPIDSKARISGEKITNDDLELWQLEIDEIKLSDETKHITTHIRTAITRHNEKNKNKKDIIYISDRRWQRAAYLLKASAFFCDRKQTNLVDILLLRHCLWAHDDKQRETIYKIVENAVRENGVSTQISYSDLEDKKNKLSKEIDKELFYSTDIFETTNIKGKKYYPIRFEEKPIYIPIEKRSTDKDFYPVDNSLNPIEEFTCNFKEQNDSFSITKTNYYNHQKLKIQFNKGDFQQDVNSRLFKEFQQDISRLFDEAEEIKKELEKHKNTLTKYLSCPFVPENLRKIAIESIDKQLQRLSVVKTDIEQIEKRIQDAQEAQ